MKRTELIRKLEEAGCEFIRHGGNPSVTGARPGPEAPPQKR